jgi:hypothetical protein
MHAGNQVLLVPGRWPRGAAGRRSSGPAGAFPSGRYCSRRSSGTATGGTCTIRTATDAGRRSCASGPVAPLCCCLMWQVREGVATLRQRKGYAVQRLIHRKTLPDELAEHRQRHGPLFIAGRLNHCAKRRPVHSGFNRVRAGGELSCRGATSLPAHRFLCLSEPIGTPLNGVSDTLLRDALRTTLGDARFEELGRYPGLSSPSLRSFDALRRCAGALCFRCHGSQCQQGECCRQNDLSLHADLHSGCRPVSSASTDRDGLSSKRSHDAVWLVAKIPKSALQCLPRPSHPHLQSARADFQNLGDLLIRESLYVLEQKGLSLRFGQ